MDSSPTKDRMISIKMSLTTILVRKFQRALSPLLLLLLKNQQLILPPTKKTLKESSITYWICLYGDKFWTKQKNSLKQKGIQKASKRLWTLWLNGKHKFVVHYPNTSKQTIRQITLKRIFKKDWQEKSKC